MYSRQEASLLRQEFWTAFGQYMLPVQSAEGEKVNWINYKTGEKFISFRMDADHKQALISIEMNHKDEGIRSLHFEQFRQFRKLLESELNETWTWEPAFMNAHGQTISRIYARQEDVSIFQKNDWPKLISFFKPRIIALDAFWSQVKYSFEALR